MSCFLMVLAVGLAVAAAVAVPVGFALLLWRWWWGRAERVARVARGEIPPGRPAVPPRPGRTRQDLDAADALAAMDRRKRRS